MKTITINLSDSESLHVDSRVRQGAFRNETDFVRELIRLDRERSCQAEIEQSLRAGLESKVEAVTNEYWEARHQALQERIIRERGIQS